MGTVSPANESRSGKLKDLVSEGIRSGMASPDTLSVKPCVVKIIPPIKKAPVKYNTGYNHEEKPLFNIDI
jgi:hypothetical protein